MEFSPEKKEAFIVTQEIYAGRKRIPLGSIGCLLKGKHNMGRIVDRKSRPDIALISGHIKPLSHHQAALLLSIKSPQKRYSLFCDEQHFTPICFLKIHDVVQLRCGRVLTVGIVRGFWERLRNPGNEELKMVLIEVELLDPRIIALSNSFSRLKVDAAKKLSKHAIGRGRYLNQNWAENNTEAAWEQDVLLKMEGAMKGIQRHCNSCYLDTTLFRHGYVGAENVMNLRRLLRSDSFITEEKDPEEFLNVLLGEVLAVEPLIRIRAGNEALEYNCYQVLVEKDGMVQMPTVQQLLEESLLSYDLKFAEVSPHQPRQKYSCIGQKLNSSSTKSQILELFAVLCIESNHYVAFVRYGASRQSWLFFDSMAGRLEKEHGSHIPLVKACPQLGHYLAMAPEEISAVDIKQMDQFSRRLFCDSYTFMYQQPKFSSYRCEFR